MIVWRTCNEDARLQILDVTGTRPPGQYGQAILCHDGYFYTVGGTNGFAYNCDIYRYLFSYCLIILYIVYKLLLEIVISIMG